MVRVRDAESIYTERIDAKVAHNRAELRATLDVSEEATLGLFADDQEISDTLSRLLDDVGPDSDVVLDISCLPKRFFFLMVKLVLGMRRIETLIVTYTQAQGAGYTYDQLAGDPEDVKAIPGFVPVEDEPEMLVVGLGFEPLGLAQLIGEYRDRERDIRVLLPFPPGQPYSRRIWRSLHSLGLDGRNQIHRVSAMDSFESCSAIGSIAEGQNTAPALAPYGPKPVSLGMCLYAIREMSPVFYTQPRFYHPEYTVGVGECWAYCLKMNGRRTF